MFVGGYFYDPFFGPYPWWTPAAYPYAYYPVYDNSADVRIQVKPKQATVYVDGYYAGIVDDFDGVFQHLDLEAGTHHIELRPEGQPPVAFDVNIQPGETITYHAR